MLEYTLQEAKDLLEQKLNTAQTTLKNVLEDLEFLRDQITTMEVSILFSIWYKIFVSNFAITWFPAISSLVSIQLKM